MWADLRFAARLFRKSPGFTAVALVTLALGIGGSTAVFSIVDGVLLRPLPFAEPERLVELSETLGQGTGIDGLSYPDFRDLRAESRSFEHVAAVEPSALSLTGDHEPDRLRSGLVSADLFATLGVAPLLGRPFSAEDDRPSSAPVTMLSHALWTERYARDPGIVGRTVRLDGRTYTVIGVMPPGFNFPDRSRIWVTIGYYAPLATFNHYEERGAHSRLRAIGRLRPGVSLAAARAEIDTIEHRMAAQYPGTNSRTTGSVTPLARAITGEVRPTLLLFLGAVGFVLLIVCANLANLLLSRAAVRRKEIVLRKALGASRGRLLRQLLTESVLLSCLGGAAGLLVAVWGLDFLMGLWPGVLPRGSEVHLDLRVLGFSLVLSGLAGVAFGVAPAFVMARTKLADTLKESAQALSRRQRLRSLLVVSEVSLALVLLISAGLLLRSFWRLRQVRPGFDAHNVLTLRLMLDSAHYKEDSQLAGFFSRLLGGVQALPGVESAGLSHAPPLSGMSTEWSSFEVEGRPHLRTGEMDVTLVQSVSPDYFHTLRIPLLSGRTFADQDDGGAPGAIVVDDLFARNHWPGQDPIGKRIGGFDRTESWFTVIGVVGHVLHEGLGVATKQEIYFSYRQMPIPVMTLNLRTPGDPASVIGAVREVVRGLDPEQPLSRIQTLSSITADSIAPQRFQTVVVGLFAALALILAALGIYGVVAYAAIQRTHEIGIRMALGARAADVLRLVMGQGLKLVGLAVVAGLAASAALTKLLASTLYGVGALDPVTYATLAALLVAISALASYLPARRATAVDPMIALRVE